MAKIVIMWGLRRVHLENDFGIEKDMEHTYKLHKINAKKSIKYFLLIFSQMKFVTFVWILKGYFIFESYLF